MWECPTLWKWEEKDPNSKFFSGLKMYSLLRDVHWDVFGKMNHSNFELQQKTYYIFIDYLSPKYLFPLWYAKIEKKLQNNT